MLSVARFVYIEYSENMKEAKHWRTYLTADEKALIKAAERAKATWRVLSAERAKIVNRAIQRARYAAKIAQA